MKGVVAIDLTETLLDDSPEFWARAAAFYDRYFTEHPEADVETATLAFWCEEGVRVGVETVLAEILARHEEPTEH